MSDDSRSSPRSATPTWVRVALPSVADLIFVALLGLLVFTPLALRLLHDAGIGWHIRTGQQILATHSIPHTDPFSSTLGGKPWFAWEWLYDLIVGQLEATLGLNGVTWLTSVVIAAVFALVFRMLIARGTGLLAALVLVLLTISASMIHFLARPHVVSWLFTLIWFWILDSSERDNVNLRPGLNQRWLWALPPLMLVWVNVHGGFVIGFVLLGIFWMGALWDWFRATGNRLEESLHKISAGHRARSLARVGLLSAAASLVNPYGWKLHAHIYSYLSNRFLMDHIDEFQSPNFHGVAQKCFLLLLLITVAVLAARGSELPMSQRLTVLFAVYAGLYASRSIPVSSILLAMVVGPLVPRVGFAAAFLERMRAIESRARGHVWPLLATLVTGVIAAHGGRVGSAVLMDAHFDPNRMPVEGVNYLEKHEIAGPVLSVDYWGGYLIYRMYPTIRVVVDDRHDFYSEKFLKLYLKAVRVEQGWEEFLDAQKSVCVLLPKNSALASILENKRAWKEIYADGTAVIFVRDPAKS